MDSSLISNLFSPEEPLSTVFSGASPPGPSVDFMSRLTSNAAGGGAGLGGARLPIGMELSPSGSGAGGADNFTLTSPSRGPDGSSEDMAPPFDILGEDDELAMAPPAVASAAASSDARRQESVLNTPSLNTPVVSYGANDSPFLKSISKMSKKK